MTSKERWLRALALQKSDRLPATVHQWQQYHLDTYLGGIDALAAGQTCGLNASIQYFAAMGQFWIPNAEKFIVITPAWREEIEIVKDHPNDKLFGTFSDGLPDGERAKHQKGEPFKPTTTR